jgi:peroxiredoxin
MELQIKKISALLLWQFVFLTAIIAQPEDNSRGYLVKVGDLAPDFETLLNNGKSFKLSDYKGKTVMLQFTASWCTVCRHEMPFIETEIWQKLKTKKFVLVGIDRDEPIDKVNEFAAQTKITYPLALDPDGLIFEKYALKDAGVTRNVIIDKNGKIIYTTRLFNREEFDAMKNIIFKAVY